MTSAANQTGVIDPGYTLFSLAPNFSAIPPRRLAAPNSLPNGNTCPETSPSNAVAMAAATSD